MFSSGFQSSNRVANRKLGFQILSHHNFPKAWYSESSILPEALLVIITTLVFMSLNLSPACPIPLPTRWPLLDRRSSNCSEFCKLFLKVLFLFWLPDTYEWVLVLKGTVNKSEFQRVPGAMRCLIMRNRTLCARCTFLISGLQSPLVWLSGYSQWARRPPIMFPRS